MAQLVYTRDELLRVHTAEYLDRLEAMSEAGYGDAGVTTPVGPGSFEVATLSAGGAIVAVDAVLDGVVDIDFDLDGVEHGKLERAVAQRLFVFYVDVRVFGGIWQVDDAV